MGKSKIEWTGYSFNPVTGCKAISAGCLNCYAKRFAERFRGVKGHPYEHGFDITLHPERIQEIYRWKKPRTVFVCSMSDLFQSKIPPKLVNDLFIAMRENPQHTFQILTKRPLRARYMSLDWPDNVWLGVSVERHDVTVRCRLLQRIPAKHRFLSLEPLIGKIRMNHSFLDGIDWVIAGCETGARARPMDLNWVRIIRDVCIECNVPFYFKQMLHGGKKITKPYLDRVQWAQLPEGISL